MSILYEFKAWMSTICSFDRYLLIIWDFVDLGLIQQANRNDMMRPMVPPKRENKLQNKIYLRILNFSLLFQNLKLWI